MRYRPTKILSYLACIALTLLLVMILVSADTVQGITEHSFPKIGIFQWGSGNAPAEHYARYDLVITSRKDSDFAGKIKEKSPNTLFLPTMDLNAGVPLATKDFPEKWQYRNSEGELIFIYSSLPHADLSRFCPKINGKTYFDAAVESMVAAANAENMDGVATDGLWSSPWNSARTNVDLDRNGINDYKEHGSDWVNTEWNSAAEKVVLSIREGIGDKLFNIQGSELLGVSPLGLNHRASCGQLAKLTIVF